MKKDSKELIAIDEKRGEVFRKIRTNESFLQASLSIKRINRLIELWKEAKSIPNGRLTDTNHIYANARIKELEKRRGELGDKSKQTSSNKSTETC